MDVIKKTKQHAMFTTLLSFGIGILLSCNAFAASFGLPETPPPPPSAAHFINEEYGGGIVFYVYDNGQHGLIASTADQNGGVPIRWYGGTFTITRARANGIGAGKENTVLIISNQGPVDGAAFAATVCNEFSVKDAHGVKYGDWYLPSKHELNLLFKQKAAVGGFKSSSYWSSTEMDSTESGDLNAWAQDFNAGAQFVLNKDAHLGVRAIRAF